MFNYAQFPVVCLLLNLFIKNKVIASGIAAGILTFVNVPLQLISYFNRSKLYETEETSLLW